jgi:hypothetical protein
MRPGKVNEVNQAVIGVSATIFSCRVEVGAVSDGLNEFGVE